MVFARLPERGKVKTRLGESIGAEKALAVYEAMLHDVLQSIGDSTSDTAIEIAWAPTESANGDALSATTFSPCRPARISANDWRWRFRSASFFTAPKKSSPSASTIRL